MKLLWEHYFSNTHKEFDVDLSCDGLPDNAKGAEKCCGLYAELSGKTVGLGVYDDRLFVMLDERAIEVDGSLSALHTADEELCKLVIEKGTDQFSFEYVNDNEPVSTPYYSETEEDADFGLWLSNVLSSPERKRIALGAWTSGAS